jgi:hypothetical protein
MICVFLVGFIVIAQLTANATANATGALIGSAATNWTNFIAYMAYGLVQIWISIALLALTPLIMRQTYGCLLGYGGADLRRLVWAIGRRRSLVALKV